MPVRRAAIEAPESRATTPSMPVPTNGASERTSGTAWRCMLEPINARLASSVGRNHLHVAGVAAYDHVLGEAPAVVDQRVRLRDRVTAFLHRREVDHLVADAAVLDLAIGRLDEAVLVHPRIGGERVDQADIGTFRRLDRADAPVMGRV